MVLDRLQKTVGSFKIGSFRGTGGTNDRTTAMFRELQRYATHFKALEKETQRWQTVVSGTFNSISDVMRVQLPKTYEETPEGQAIPSESDVGIIGEGVNVDGLAAAGNSHVIQLDQVVRSTQGWLGEFRDVQNKMKALESIRNDLDARNRKVQSLRGKIDQLRTRLQTAKPGTNLTRDESLLVETQQQLEMASQSVEAMEQNYRSTEQETYESQLNLAQKCPQLQEIAANLIRICQGTFRSAYDAFAVSYGVASSYQSGGTLDKSGAVAYQLGDASYPGYPQSPEAAGWPGNGDGHNRNVSYGDSEAGSYSQQPNQYGWGAPKPDDYSIESARHMNRYPKVNY